MPIDCHVHFVLDGRDWKESIRLHKQGEDEQCISKMLDVYRKAGYTYLRDGGDKWGVGYRTREMAQQYNIIYKTPGAPICKQGHYGRFIGNAFEDMHDFARLVEKNKAEAADFLKIMISGLMDFDTCGRLTEEGLDPVEIREMIHIGKDMGLAVMAHANGARTVEAAAEAGVDSIEHGAYLDDAALHAMVEAGTVWVPTVSTIGNLLGKGRFREDAVSEILDSVTENLQIFADMGGLIASGSDAGAWSVFHGEDTEDHWLKTILKDRTEAVVAKGNAAIMDKF